MNKYLPDTQPQIPTFVIQHMRLVNQPISDPVNLDPGSFLAANLALNVTSNAVGVYEYQSQSRLELDVQIGAKFSILVRDGEWCVVERNGQRGSVPTSSLFSLDKADRSHAGQTVLCIDEYSRKTKYELSVHMGDKLVLLERYHHWYLAHHKDAKEATGLVPFSHITLSAETSPIQHGARVLLLKINYRDVCCRKVSRKVKAKKASSDLNLELPCNPDLIIMLILN
jgi:hypothetical protein